MQITTGPTLLFVPLVQCVMSRKIKQQNKKNENIWKKQKPTGQFNAKRYTNEKNRNNETYTQMHYFHVYNNEQSEFVRFVDISDK